MQSKTLVVLSAVGILGVNPTAMARGGGMAMHSGGMAMHGHGHFVPFQFRNDFLRNQFLRNQFSFGGGWGWDWGSGLYDYSGYGNTTVVAIPQAIPQASSSVTTTPCHWNRETFTVPSSAGGTRPIQILSCR
jgi:hypothetical protein